MFSDFLARQRPHIKNMINIGSSGTYLYWLKPEDRKKLEVCGADKGLVQDSSVFEIKQRLESEEKVAEINSNPEFDI